MTKPEFKPWDNEERLRQLYWDAGMSQPQIADLFGTTSSTISRAMHRHGINARSKSKYAKFRTRTDGYESWSVDNSLDGSCTIYIHQLVAIAEGADPFKVFGNSQYVVHHDNGYKWDNRANNLMLLEQSEHLEIHTERGDIEQRGRNKQYDKSEMLEWIDSFVQELGFVPTQEDILGWPGPSPRTYTLRFGSFVNAIEEAGHTPRGKTDDG